MMLKQVLLSIVCFLSWLTFASAKVPTDSTIVVPSPQEEKTEMKTPEKTYDLERHDFLIEKTTPQAPSAPIYHLDPRPSLTLALSRAYEFKDKDNSGWIGAHVSPWMSATLRSQIGIDLHGDQGWITAALHSLPTRNLYRLYWGGGISLIFNSKDELRPLLRIRNYYASLIGGWELQLLENQSVRFEVSYNQGTQKQFARGTVGYTFYF